MSEIFNSSFGLFIVIAVVIIFLGSCARYLERISKDTAAIRAMLAHELNRRERERTSGEY